MIRVLYVISDRNIGGAGVLLCNLLRNIDRRHFQCAVALPYGSDLRERLLPLEVSIWELERPCDTLNAASIRELISVVRRFDAHIVHANAAVSARMAGRLCGRAVIHTRHCCFPIGKRGLSERIVQNLGNRTLSDMVIATSKTAAENLRELGIPKKKLQIILNGSDPVREAESWEVDALRDAWGLDADDYCVGLCARLEPCKGHSVFLRAAEILKERDLPVNLKLIIVGEGSLRKNLEQNIRALGLSEIVKMVGFVDDMAPVYRLLRIHVNCSCGTETSCLAVSEGMSAGLPTIVSDYGGNPAMIGNSEAGIVTPVGEAEALANAICRIASDQVVENRMSDAARERYWQHFTAKQMTEQTEDVYRRVLLQRER